MDNLVLKFAQEHHCAVAFVDCKSSVEDLIYKLQAHLKKTSLEQCLVICSYSLPQPWLENRQDLEIIFLLIKNKEHLNIEKFSVQDKKNLAIQVSGTSHMLGHDIIVINTDMNFYMKIKNEFNQQKFFFGLNEPLLLEPVFIPKPWGQEIWYTGVEKRGVSKIASASSINLGSHNSIPQPWFFSVLPKTMCGEKYYNKSLILIKILDPLDHDVYGDLYYELHQQKNEVYIVTDISTEIGQIKMGVNPVKIEQYKSNIEQLKSDFLTAIEKYEVIRRKIDARSGKIPEELQAEEILLRKNMNEFAGYLNLKVGDVIAVPILVPHALQHGVRVIEFQTPTYERLIISFAQKVLTQNHWDSKLAIQLMEASAPQKTDLIKLSQKEEYLLELVCSFPDFYAVRVALKNRKEYVLKKEFFYQVLFVVKGKGELLMDGKNYSVSSHQCFFLPALCQVALLASQQMEFLICAPEKF